MTTPTDRIEEAARECWDSMDAVAGGTDEDCIAAIAAIAALVRRVRDEAVRAERHEAFANFIAKRGVTVACSRCQGIGVRLYPNTATWRNGIGGQAITSDVCDRCWGSGDEHRHWVSHREAAAAIRARAASEPNDKEQA